MAKTPSQEERALAAQEKNDIDTYVTSNERLELLRERAEAAQKRRTAAHWSGDGKAENLADSEFTEIMLEIGNLENLRFEKNHEASPSQNPDTKSNPAPGTGT